MSTAEGESGARFIEDSLQGPRRVRVVALRAAGNRLSLALGNSKEPSGDALELAGISREYI